MYPLCFPDKLSKPSDGVDDHDGGFSSKSPRSAPSNRRKSATAMDDIDGRGTFMAKDLEKELREMHRDELQNQLGETLLFIRSSYLLSTINPCIRINIPGISWNKIGEIIRRSDFDRDGEIEYKDFLETVKRYRLSTEQATTLNSIVKAFAYAEEFSCR